MKTQQFKNQIHKMTKEQKQKWVEIHNRLVDAINEKEFKTKTSYKNAMAKVYDKTIAEYLKTEKLK